MQVPNPFKYANGFPANDLELETFFKSVPGSAYCKDKKGKYLAVNDVFLYTNSSTNASDILGKTDKVMRWETEAPLMMQNDNKIVCIEKSGTFIESAYCFGNKMRYFLSHKLPLLNSSGKKIGTIGASFLLDDVHVVTEWLKGAGFLIDYDPTKLMAAQKKQELTPRQIDCLIYLVKGMTIKQIARHLDLSPKTVEHYLYTVRKKLHCHSRHELFTKALQIPCIRESLI